MTTFNTNVPLPKIPESNASYTKRVEALAKLAGKAGALAQARDFITGTNTYAKMLRRFADALIVEANGGPLQVAAPVAPPPGAVSFDAVLAALGEPADLEANGAIGQLAAANAHDAAKPARKANIKAIGDAAMSKADVAKAAKLAKLEAREAAATAKEKAKAKPVKLAKVVKAAVAKAAPKAKAPVMGTAKPKAVVLTPDERKAKNAADRKRQRDALKAAAATAE
jgi:hypothetical protein